MEFELADHQRAAQKLVREFAQAEVAPRIRELDRAQQFDRTILRTMAGLGSSDCASRSATAAPGWTT